MKRIYAIKNNKIVCNIDVSPFSIESLNKLCIEKGFDGWFELDIIGACQLMQIDREGETENGKTN